MEAQEFIVMGKWLELASLMITSAELIFSKVSEKGRMLCFATSSIVFIFHFVLILVPPVLSNFSHGSAYGMHVLCNHLS